MKHPASSLSPSRAAESKPPARPLWRLGGALVLLVAALLAYFPAVKGEPLWDDISLVVNHAFIKSPWFALELFRQWTYPEALSIYYRPVQMLSYMGDYLFWRGNPVGYHLTNIFIHAVAGMLLFFLLERLLPRLASLPQRTVRLLAFALALLWVVHPIHNAAVAYISGRADPLAMVFALAAWLLYLRSRESDRPGLRRSGWIGAFLLALLALCAKEIAFTWVLLFWLLEGWMFSGRPRDRWKLLAVLVVLSGVYLFLHQLPPARTAEKKMMPSPMSERPLLVVRALGDYTRLVFWPDNLHMCRSVSPELVYPNLKEWYPNGGPAELTWIGLGTLAAFGVGCRWKGRGQRMRQVGVLWFVIGFFPISNIVALNAQVAEHWIYMPSIGYLLFLTGWALELPDRWRRWGIPFLVVATAALTVRTAVRANDWTSRFRFFGRTIQDGGYDIRVFYHYARAQADRGNPEEAERLYWRFLEADPTNETMLLGLAELYKKQNRTDELEAILHQINPRGFTEYGVANRNLALIEARKQNYDLALAYLDRSLNREPSARNLIPARAEVLELAGRTEEARTLLEAYTRERYWDRRSFLGLAQFYLRNGPEEQALPLLEEAAWMDIWATEPMQIGALVELKRNRPEAALEWVERGLQRQPGSTLYQLQAEALAKLGRKEVAENALLEARAWKIIESRKP